ncbi:unnamed protein product [Oppiella nova]|uniref:Uncharacterized protein n=1 Tax=Oppiella nova TaxID=334625 RepID=A0A7R9MAC9_9ACAR|nr:unnamed protein product [Oppiella nova]CAG2172434.1 unnamed protein product [Oppiella nova]
MHTTRYQMVGSRERPTTISTTTTSTSRSQLRWSQSFSPTDRQKPNVSTPLKLNFEFLEHDTASSTGRGLAVERR